MRRLLALALVAGALGGGCGEDDDAVGDIDWDLTQSHTTADVDWPERAEDLSAAEIRPDGRVRVQLPAGKAFTAQPGVIRRIPVERDGDRVVSISFASKPLRPVEALDLARGWASQFLLPQAPIDAWAEKARASGAERVPTGLSSSPRDAQLGEGGPIPSIDLRDVSDESVELYVVALELIWPDAAAPSTTATQP